MPWQCSKGLDEVELGLALGSGGAVAAGGLRPPYLVVD